MRLELLHSPRTNHERQTKRAHTYDTQALVLYRYAKKTVPSVPLLLTFFAVWHVTCGVCTG